MSKLPFDAGDFSLIDTVPPDAAHGVGIEITGHDDEGLKRLSAFLMLSRSGKALVSNEFMSDIGERMVLVFVRKIDGELSLAGVHMYEGITRKALVKCMRDAGVKVQSVSGVSFDGMCRVQA